MMKLNAVAVASTNIPKTLEFYRILGFTFPEFKAGEEHIETVIQEGETKLMIDSFNMIKSILGEAPKAGNHSSFAIQYDTPKEIDDTVEKLNAANFKIAKAPWDAFWGQHYAVVQDPDGYLVDLYAAI